MKVTQELIDHDQVGEPPQEGQELHQDRIIPARDAAHQRDHHRVTRHVILMVAVVDDCWIVKEVKQSGTARPVVVGSVPRGIVRADGVIGDQH
ncbi:MAG: hypothetical protein ACK2U2_12580, partial [Anaerolineae bacterium]